MRAHAITVAADLDQVAMMQERQGPEQHALEAHAGRFRRRPMKCQVRRPGHPVKRLSVKIGVVEEAPPVREALAHVVRGLEAIGSGGGAGRTRRTYFLTYV